jgi:hypothetical protein
MCQSHLVALTPYRPHSLRTETRTSLNREILQKVSNELLGHYRNFLVADRSSHLRQRFRSCHESRAEL